MATHWCPDCGRRYDDDRQPEQIVLPCSECDALDARLAEPDTPAVA